MNIEIITTPNSALKETGFGSHLACASVLKSIGRTNNKAVLTVCASLNDLDDVVKRRPDLVFLAAKYMPVENGEDIWFSDYFAINKITFSGSSRDTLKYDSDKILAKIHLNGLGVKTARHFTAIPTQFHCEEELPLVFPLFLKPSDAANGNGIDDLSFVDSFEAFEAKVLSLYKIYGMPVLVEEYLGGREFTVAIIQSSHGELMTSVIEILPPESTTGLKILGADVKKHDTENLQEIASIDMESVKALAIAAFGGLGVRGFGRIDIKMDGDGQCYFMEANLVPGMTFGSSYFPRACEIANKLSYDEVVCLMLDECLGRVVPDQANLLGVLRPLRGKAHQLPKSQPIQ